jgi:glutamyl-tRNA synthetase
VVRLLAPEEGTVTYDDLVFGTIVTPNSAQQDMVLVRSDGVPLYNFGAVVDDISMGITLVARGREHMINTPPQILMYEALGYEAPQFAHLPLMLAPSGEKLSKRHGAVSVGEYRSLGYPPMGILNYLVRFGWSSGDEEIFSREELIAKFDFDHVGRADGKFDAKKFADVAFEHLKRPDLTPVRKYAKMVLPFLEAIGIAGPDETVLLRAIPTIRERARTLGEAATAMSFFFRTPEFEEKAKKKFLTPETAPRLAALVELLTPLSTWDETALESTVSDWLSRENLTIKDVAQPARVAITGRAVSPGLYEVLAVLGKDLSLARLRRGIELAGVSAP